MVQSGVLVSLRQVILATSYCEERREQAMHNSMFVNVIGMTKACWCGPALHTISLHIFERGNVTLERYLREINLDHVRLFRGPISPYFCLWATMRALTETLRHQTL